MSKKEFIINGICVFIISLIIEIYSGREIFQSIISTLICSIAATYVTYKLYHFVVRKFKL